MQRAIMEGDEKTGVTLMYMAEGLDTGDMIAKAETEVGRKTTGELLEELAAIGGELLVEKLPEIAANAILDACTGSNPRQPNQEEMEKLLKCCYYDTEVDF